MLATEAQAKHCNSLAMAPSAWSALNLGCGSRFHPAWTNLDLNPTDALVQRWDVMQPLPFADEAFDAVYHSHLLEHLPRDRALPFLQECRRVLKPGGVMRLAIPNLEAIARLYLYTLEDAWFGDAEAASQHRWLTLEMYDQATRETPGGAMATLGDSCELARFRLGNDTSALAKGEPLNGRSGWFTACRERFLRWLLGSEYALLQLGRFRRRGEVRQWMYDRVSLRALLTEAGFERFRCVGSLESAIPKWSNFHLDTTPAGDVCQPDSLFVEVQPRAADSGRTVP